MPRQVIDKSTREVLIGSFKKQLRLINKIRPCINSNSIEMSHFQALDSLTECLLLMVEKPKKKRNQKLNTT